MKTIGIVGGGYVGRAIQKLFEDHYRVYTYDIANSPEYLKDVAYTSDVVFVCVPTPMREDGTCDTSIVESVVAEADAPLIIIKSTVTPGTTERLQAKYGKHIVFAPEYCGESTYWSPYKWDREIKEMPFFIFGGAPGDTSKAVDLYLPVVGPTKIFRQTTAKVAEMVKYAVNCFYAAKITFCYELNQICQRAGVDYNQMRDLWLLDPRINPMHTAVFAGNDAPFGGKCFPKDLNGLVAWAETELNYSPELLNEVLSSNYRIEQYRKNGWK